MLRNLLAKGSPDLHLKMMVEAECRDDYASSGALNVVSQESSGSVPIPQTKLIVSKAEVGVEVAPGVPIHQGTPLTLVIPGYRGILPVPTASDVSAEMKHYKDAWIYEFHRHKQGDMSVARYDQSFNELTRYVPFIVQDEEHKKMKFLRGLHPFFRRFLISSGASNYREVLSKALALEQNEAEDRRPRNVRNPVRQDTRPDKGKAVRIKYDRLGSKRQRFEGTPVWATGGQYLKRA
ncbi:hypothetical protein GIB67_020019 [Kingdonia uniflora]|uniref:Retrotransposon gag domain-containing protein n=1 Tax=Kingdonia uniflora TaxID=39325 RepID=A0A7J7NEY8_9MAGN|nr:hypothetical protein GIB67_020019 [Kingdonia uniflora]